MGQSLTRSQHAQFCTLRPSYQTIILRVRSDPEPDKIGAILDSKRPVMQTHAHGPELPQFLEVQ
jgi:hypothetical protein